MSATGRSDVRHPDDDYVTPTWCVHSLLDALPAIAAENIVDPGCGSGAILDALSSTGLDATLMGIELDKGRAKEAQDKGHSIIQGDFTKRYAAVKNAEAVIMNPPYKLALSFVTLAIHMCLEEMGPGASMKLGWRPGGFVAALLRLSFLESKRRHDFWVQNPADVYVLSKRPSFTGGGTDAAAYAWFVWGQGPRGRVTVI